MVEDLCEEFGRYKTWDYSTNISDHKDIMIELDFDRDLVYYPLKFNPV